ncbi:M23 family metallopeptidase [Cryptosporangium phraense]|uniref:M23 family metallopeptidase n=1 Tax=Cryptosporangium phraense TaxID=2593070 RepID=A0A545ANL9_9ACTN|nr:M23 family metallopeptidase [Cryptosporangium phraense]TQS42870.1 M23 family metallopeptidase [Cryptosporangium phraense]
MRVGRRRVFCLVVAIGAGLLVHQPVVQARNGPSPADRAAAQRAMQRAAAIMETATARAQAATAAFVETSQRLPGAQTRVATAQGRVTAAAVRATAAERASARAAAALGVAEQHFAAAQAAVDEARDTLGTYVRATYEGHSAMVLSAVSAADGPEDLLDRLNFATQLIGRQHRAVDAVERRRQDVAEQRAIVAEHKRRVDAARAAAQRALAAARAEQSAAQAARAEVLSLVAQRRNAVVVANQEKQASQERYADAQAESNRIARALRAVAHRERRSSGRSRSYRPRSRPGGLWMPVAGWKSSDFGYRFDPYFRRWQLHAGTDFAAPEGAPIHAAASGVVVRAGWNGGYGNYTCIYHGGDLSTCYGHQSRILVSPGQEVSRGETIGLVGTTGASTGDHLHFEVRIDGSPVNPLGYL